VGEDEWLINELKFYNLWNGGGERVLRRERGGFIVSKIFGV
jgi:hypothetical protein